MSEIYQGGRDPDPNPETVEDIAERVIQRREAHPMTDQLKQHLDRLAAKREAAKVGPLTHYNAGDTNELRDSDGKPVVSWMGFDDSDRSADEHRANAAALASSFNTNPALVRCGLMLAKVQAHHEKIRGDCSCHLCMQAIQLLRELDAAAKGGG